MQFYSQPDVLGYVELKVGSQKVQVPIRVSPEDDRTTVPMATFMASEGVGSIFVDADAAQEPRSNAFHQAVCDAALDAERHLSRKLLN